MKRLTIKLSGLLVLLVLAFCSAKAEDTKVIVDNDEVKITLSSVSYNANGKEVVTQWEYKNPEKSGCINVRLIQIYDLNNNLVTLLTQYTRNLDRTISGKSVSIKNLEWEKIIPGSYYAKIANYINNI